MTLSKHKESLLVFIPTYNERDNVEKLFEQIQAQHLKLDVLFMDDNSTDGTGEILDELASKHPNLKIIHRSSKLGVGSAHYDGIIWAYEQGYNNLITMDCDFSHPPEYISKIFDTTKDFDVVIGSRFLKNGSLENWNFYRKALTFAGHLVTQGLLRLPQDATGAFRFYRLNKIPKHVFELVASQGYSFFIESLYILSVNGFKIGQIPIHLPARTYGHSKMDSREVVNTIKFICATSIITHLNKERFRVAEPVEISNHVPADTQGWDTYWNVQKNASGILYDIIAAFYRKFIIKRTLNYFVKSYFKPGTHVLHAGCGSGQVDTDIRHFVSITGLDISVNALNFYRRTNRNYCKILHGSVFEIPLADCSIEGIYNLGVMEHFTEEEISKILKEFHRVLKPGGRVIIFWPPEFGMSVVFFKLLKLFFEKVLMKKDVKFHPDELTRIRSQRHARDIFNASNFEVLRYYFGLKDFFTYSIIVAEKTNVISWSLPVTTISLPRTEQFQTANSIIG